MRTPLPPQVLRLVHSDLVQGALWKERQALLAGIDPVLEASLSNRDRGDAQILIDLEALNRHACVTSLRRYLDNAKVLLKTRKCEALEKAISLLDNSRGPVSEPTREPKFMLLGTLASLATPFVVERDAESLASIDPALIERATEKLSEHRVLLVVSPDERTTSSALNAIATREQFGGETEKRKITFDTLRNGEDDIQIDLLLEEELKHDKDMLLAVVATNRYAGLFIDNLLNCSILTLKDIKAKSRAARRYVLIGMTAASSSRHPAAFVSEDICVVIPSNKAAAPETPEDRRGAVVDHEERRRWSPGRATVEKTALFVAAFFPRISAEEFDEVMLLLLGEELEVTVQGTDPAAPAVRPMKLRERWAAERSSVLDRCGLVYGPVDEERVTVGVQFPVADGAGSVRAEILRLDYLFYVDRVRHIDDAGLLFTASERLSEQVVELLADAADRSPNERGRSSFMTTVQNALSAMSLAPRTDALPLRPELVDVLRSIKQAQLFDRIALFLRELRTRARLTDMDKEVLNQLMGLGCHQAVVALVRRMRGAQGFDSILWFQRLLNDGDGDAKDAAAGDLYRRVCWNNPEARRTLLALCGWLGAESTSPASQMAANLLVDLHESSIVEPSAPGGALVSSLLSSDPGEERAAVIEALVVALIGSGVDTVLDDRRQQHFHLAVGFWLLPPDLAERLPDDGISHVVSLATTCGAAVEIAMNRVRSPITPCEWMFHAICWADWAARTWGANEGGARANAGVPPGCEALYCVIDDALKSLGPRGTDARAALSAYWVAFEDCLRQSLLAVGSMRGGTADERRVRAAARETLELRRRAVRSIRERLGVVKRSG